MSNRHASTALRDTLERAQAASSNLTGILMTVESGLIRLAKQTAYGEEYVATATDASTAWHRLSRITGTPVGDLQRLRLTRIQ